MPLRDTEKYLVKIKGEPKEVYKIRKKIIEAFENLEFIDEGHIYYLNMPDGTKLELPSVSGFSAKFHDEFDTNARAIKYAKDHGGTPDGWKDAWQYNSLMSTTRGTIVHEYGEGYSWMKYGHPELIPEPCLRQYIPDKNWLIPVDPKMSAAKDCIDFLAENDMHLVMNETKIYVTESDEPYAGCFDSCYYYKHPTDDSKSGIVLTDWKTNKELYSEYNRAHGKMMYPPFNSKYFDESYSKYTIQLCLYQIALENIGLKVIARRVLWLKEDGTYEIIKIDDVTKELREYFNIPNPSETKKKNKKTKQ